MFEILLDKQFWSTVVNSSANILIAAGMIVQTIIFYITFKEGLQYLNQHKKKVKIEKNVELSQKIIYNLYRLNGIGESIFENITFLSARDYINNNQLSDIPDEFKDPHARLTLIHNNFDQKSFQIPPIISETLMLIDFLKDEEAKLLALKLKDSFWAIKIKIWSNHILVDGESEFSLEKMDPTKRKDYIREKRKDFKGFVPLSFHDLKFNEIKVFQKNFENLRNHLLKNHIP